MELLNIALGIIAAIVAGVGRELVSKKGIVVMPKPTDSDLDLGIVMSLWISLVVGIYAVARGFSIDACLLAGWAGADILENGYAKVKEKIG